MTYFVEEIVDKLPSRDNISRGYLDGMYEIVQCFHRDTGNPSDLFMQTPSGKWARVTIQV